MFDARVSVLAGQRWRCPSGVAVVAVMVVVVMSVLTACTTPPDAGPPDDGMAVSIDWAVGVLEVVSGASDCAALTVARSGPVGDVTLGVEGPLPPGVSVSFSPEVLGPGETTSRLTVTADAASVADHVDLTVVAVAAITEAKAALTLIVSRLLVMGRVVDGDGHAIPAVGVEAQGHTDVTGLDGSFLLPDIAVPYDVTPASRSLRVVHRYDGLTSPEPELVMFEPRFSSPDRYQAVASGLVLDGDPVPPGELVTICAEAVDANVDSPVARRAGMVPGAAHARPSHPTRRRLRAAAWARQAPAVTAPAGRRRSRASRNPTTAVATCARKNTTKRPTTSAIGQPSATGLPSRSERVDPRPAQTLNFGEYRQAMRRIVAQEYMTLDGVMQAPGGPDEDTSNQFPYGGWTAPFGGGDDPRAKQFMANVLAPADLLLGRKTFEIFESYWPDHAENWPGVMDVTKYVVSTTLDENEVADSRWPNSKLLRSTDEVEELRRSEGSHLKMWGSSVLVQSLLARGLIDELVLMTYPVLLGTGKRLFADRAEAGSYRLLESVVTSHGVYLAHYERAGRVQTGTVGE
jgi:dihydrofolate reductase